MLLLILALCPVISFSFTMAGFLANIPIRDGPALVGKSILNEIV